MVASSVEEGYCRDPRQASHTARFLLVIQYPAISGLSLGAINNAPAGPESAVRRRQQRWHQQWPVSSFTTSL